MLSTLLPFPTGLLCNPDGKYAEIQIGLREETPEKKEALQTAWECMKEAGLDCHISQDIQAAVWEKYIFNCGYNVITTYYMAMVEELWKDQEKCKEFRQLMEEAYQVAMAKHIHIREGYVDSKYDRFMHLDVGSTSSMKRDFEGERPVAGNLQRLSGIRGRTASGSGTSFRENLSGFKTKKYWV